MNFCAAVIDRYWYVLMRNASTLRFFNHFIDLEARKPPRNLLQLMFDPKGMRPFITNWPEVAASLFQRINRESACSLPTTSRRKIIAS